MLEHININTIMRIIIIHALLCLISIHAQNRIGTGDVKMLYQDHCMNCHGVNLEGGIGGSLLGDSLMEENGTSKDFIQYLKFGNLDMGMPGFGEVLSDSQIRTLQIYIQEMQQKKRLKGSELEVSNQEVIFKAGGYTFRLETVISGLHTPWSIAFIEPEKAIITERDGSLRVWESGILSEAISGIPQVNARGQGGLLEVATHPEYKNNKWVYLSYSGSSDTDQEKPASMTKIVRGRIVDSHWCDQEVIFETGKEYHHVSGVHFGTRFVFKDGYLFFGIGDRGKQDQAQDLTRPNGKIHRIHDDGRIPLDNPFLHIPNSYPSIWTYGNRNPQGLDLHPLSGDIYESEHGPRGGDEINLIESGLNYGWPLITYGMNYDGSPITEKTAAENMEQPLHYWTPSIAVCGIDFYEGNAFPSWKYDLFAGGLASQELHRLVIIEGKVVSTEVILKNKGRVRDVATGPDGMLYLVMNDPDEVVRLVPCE